MRVSALDFSDRGEGEGMTWAEAPALDSFNGGWKKGMAWGGVWEEVASGWESGVEICGGSEEGRLGKGGWMLDGGGWGRGGGGLGGGGGGGGGGGQEEGAGVGAEGGWEEGVGRGRRGARRRRRGAGGRGQRGRI